MQTTNKLTKGLGHPSGGFGVRRLRPILVAMVLLLPMAPAAQAEYQIDCNTDAVCAVENCFKGGTAVSCEGDPLCEAAGVCLGSLVEVWGDSDIEASCKGTLEYKTTEIEGRASLIEADVGFAEIRIGTISVTYTNTQIVWTVDCSANFVLNVGGSGGFARDVWMVDSKGTQRGQCSYSGAPGHTSCDIDTKDAGTKGWNGQGIADPDAEDDAGKWYPTEVQFCPDEVLLAKFIVKGAPSGLRESVRDLVVKKDVALPECEIRAIVYRTIPSTGGAAVAVLAMADAAAREAQEAPAL